MMLVKLFIQTDPTVLPIGLVLSLISNLASLAFLSGAHCVLRDTLHPVTGAAWMRKRNAVGGFGFEAVETVNDTRKRAMARKVSSIFSGVLRGKTVAILGLTFKPTGETPSRFSSRVASKGPWQKATSDTKFFACFHSHRIIGAHRCPHVLQRHDQRN
jgi:hypothetical protein